MLHAVTNRASVLRYFASAVWTVLITVSAAQVLLGEQRVDEAVELCEQQGGPQHQRLVLSVLQRAGFLRMIQEQYHQAADYFLRGQLDPREVGNN